MAFQPTSQILHHLYEALNSLVVAFPYEPVLIYIDFLNLAGTLRLLRAERGAVAILLAMYKII
jgi:hypothetical protein